MIFCNFYKLKCLNINIEVGSELFRFPIELIFKRTNIIVHLNIKSPHQNQMKS